MPGVAPQAEAVGSGGGPSPEASLSPKVKAPRTFLKRGAGRGTVGTQVPSQSAVPRGAGKVLPFLRGVGCDSKGRTLSEILSWDHDQMERVHDYIQWVFPTHEHSKHNLGAPLLTPELQRRGKDDPVIVARLRTSFEWFCNFLGTEVVQEVNAVDERDHATAVVRVRKASHWESRVPICWSTRCTGNHNWLRISRMLCCCRLLGLHAEAAGMLEFLDAIHAEGYPVEYSVRHWRKQAAVGGSSSGASGPSLLRERSRALRFGGSTTDVVEPAAGRGSPKRSASVSRWQVLAEDEELPLEPSGP